MEEITENGLVIEDAIEITEENQLGNEIIDSKNENLNTIEEIVLGGEEPNDVSLVSEADSENFSSRENKDDENFKETGLILEKTNLEETIEKTTEETIEKTTESVTNHSDNAQIDEMQNKEDLQEVDSENSSENNQSEITSKKDDIEIVVEGNSAPSKFDNIFIHRISKVYVLVNSEGFITNVCSNLTGNYLEGWTLYDEGEGEKYDYPQNCYFELPLIDENGNYRYKFNK